MSERGSNGGRRGCDLFLFIPNLSQLFPVKPLLVLLSVTKRDVTNVADVIQRLSFRTSPCCDVDQSEGSVVIKAHCHSVFLLCGCNLVEV